MKLTIFPLVIPLAAAGAAAAIVPVSTWESWRSGLLPALSVVAAAVLVRLARGLPFTNADHFQLGEFRDVAARMQKISKSLRMLIYVCLAAMVAVIIAPSAIHLARRTLIVAVDSWLERLVSFSLAYSITYAFVRLAQVVEGDVSLLKLQSSILEGVLARKNAKAFEERQAGAVTPAIAGAESYGKPLQ